MKTKEEVKEKVKHATKPEDKFRALFNGILDQAEELVRNKATETEMMTAIDRLRMQVGEAVEDIFGKGK